MPKVGEGWVEITTRVDQTSLRNAQRQLADAFDDFDVDVGVDINTTELAEAVSLLHSAFEGVVASISSDVDRSSLARAIQTMNASLDAANINAAIGADVNQASLARARQQINAALSNIEVNVRIDTRRSLFDRFFGSQAADWVRTGETSGRGFVSGFLTQVANAFELSGPIGGAIIVGLAAIFAAAAIPLGAMLGGAITVAFTGVAGIGAGIIAAIDAPEVASAFDRLKQRFRDVFIDNENLDIISKKFAEVIEIATDAILGTPLIEKSFGDVTNPFPPGTKAHAEWQPFESFSTEGGIPGLTPFFESILTRGMDFLVRFVQGIVDIAYILVPAFDELINSPFATSAFDAFVQGLARVATTIAEGWQDILDDPKAQAGMALGVQDFFGLLSFLIGVGFDFIRFVSRQWHDIRTERDATGMTDFEKVQELFGHLGKIFGVIGGFIAVFFAIWKKVVWDNPLFWEFMDQIDGFLGRLADALFAVAKFIDSVISIFDIFGGNEGSASGNIGGGLFGSFDLSGLATKFQEALNAIKTGGWAGLGQWFTDNVWTKIQVGLGPLLTAIGTGFISAVTGIRTGNWSTLAQWFGTNVWSRLPPPAQTALSVIGTVFTSTVAGIRTGNWSSLASWFSTNVWSRLPPSATAALNSVTAFFQGAANQVRSGGWASLPGWFISNVANPIVSGMANAIGGLPRAIESIGFAVRVAIVNVINGAIGRVRSAVIAINALPFIGDLPLPNYIGYARGGFVDGPPSIRDTVPAMLSTGEFVVNARATAQHRPLLEAINDGKGLMLSPEINVYIDGVKAAQEKVVDEKLGRVAQRLGARAHM